MMKLLLYPALLLLTLPVPGQHHPVELEKARAILFSEGSKEERKAGFCKEMAERQSHDPVLRAYSALATMMKAEYTKNPFKKLQYFERGKDALEQLITRYPENLEMRFIRFSAQINIPAILNYKDAIEADKHFILQGIQAFRKVPGNKEFSNEIISYMLSTGHCTMKEVKKVLS